MKAPRLARVLDVSRDVVEQGLVFLREKKLIFQEKDLSMSLVVRGTSTAETDATETDATETDEREEFVL